MDGRHFPVSWDQMHRDARALAWRLSGHGPWEQVIAVTRGGLVPAAIVARELDIRLIDTVCVAAYDHMHRSEVRILKSVPGPGAGLVVVDDLVDTGATMTAVRAMLPAAHIAAVYAKPEGRALVDTYVTEVSQDTWIDFPWDTELRFVDPIIKAEGG